MGRREGADIERYARAHTKQQRPGKTRAQQKARAGQTWGTYVPWFPAGGMLSREYCKCGGMAGGSLMYSSGSTGGQEYLPTRAPHGTHMLREPHPRHMHMCTRACMSGGMRTNSAHTSVCRQSTQSARGTPWRCACRLATCCACAAPGMRESAHAHAHARPAHARAWSRGKYTHTESVRHSLARQRRAYTLRRELRQCTGASPASDECAAHVCTRGGISSQVAGRRGAPTCCAAKAGLLAWGPGPRRAPRTAPPPRPRCSCFRFRQSPGSAAGPARSATRHRQ